MENYKNPALSPEQRAADLLSRLSLEEKMAQLTGVFIATGADFENVKDYIGYGIGQASCLEMRTLETSEACSALQREFQDQVMSRSPHHIPAIFHMEGLCGPLFQDTTSFPSGIGRASSWNPELEQKIGQIVGRQEKAMGITHTAFYNVAPDPTLACAREGAEAMTAFRPDLIIALGGGSAMDAA